MSKSEKLLQRIKIELGVKLGPQAKIRRTYAGKHQKIIGVFIWHIVDVKLFGRRIGGNLPVSYLYNCPTLKLVKRDSLSAVHTSITKSSPSRSYDYEVTDG